MQENYKILVVDDDMRLRALLKKEVGDLAVVETSAGEASWCVNEVVYVK